MVIDKPSGVALQGQHGSPPRQHWDQLVQGALPLSRFPTHRSLAPSLTPAPSDSPQGQATVPRTLHRPPPRQGPSLPLARASEPPPAHLVPALPQSTTGALLVAKSRPAAKALSSQLSKHDVARSYLAVVHGRLRDGFEGLVDHPLRLDHDKVRLCPEGEGVHALTRWQCIAASVRPLSLPLCREVSPC